MKTIQENVTFLALQELDESLNEDQIVDNLLPLFALKRRTDQDIRDLSSKILARLSSGKLVACFTHLIELLRSPYAFVRDEAEDLLDRINSEDLFDHFDDLRELEKDENFGVKRFATATILKVAIAWPLKEKQRHYNLILEWQKSSDERTVRVANFMALQVMELWETKSLEPFMPFLVDQADFNKHDIETVELAVSLSFEFLSQADLSLRLSYVDYMTGFSDYGIKEIRRGFRHLALETIKFVDVSQYAKYALFFLRCLEGKNKDDRTTAWKNLLMINPNDLPVCQLVYCQISGLYRVRRAGKKLAKRVGYLVILENLEDLLLLQDSECYEARYLARHLIMKIPLVKFQMKKDIITKYANSRSLGSSSLAEVLLGFC